MKNYKNHNRRNRFKSNNERNFHKNGNGQKLGSDFSSNSNFQRRNPGRNNQNASTLVEKYANLAREALSIGDKTLSENYFQHADHFARILGDRQVIKNANDENKIKETNGKKEPIKEKTLNSKEQNSSEN